MKITLFTIRDKNTKELIYAEGIDCDEYRSYFKLDKKYFTAKEKETILKDGGWYFNGEVATFSEEIRYLNNYPLEFIEINTKEVYDFDSLYSLKKV